MRVLIVDDSKVVRMLVARMMRDSGFETVDAENGRDALNQLAATGPVNLALVDWNMPEMSGIEFVKAVRTEAAHNDMKIIMLTGDSEADQAAAALEAGANAYVVKPLKKEALEEKLAALGIG